VIVEERIYRTRSGKILGNLIGYYTTEIGTLNQVIHMWGYSDFEDRMRRRKILAEDPRWQEFIPRLTENIETGFSYRPTFRQ